MIIICLYINKLVVFNVVD